MITITICGFKTKLEAKHWLDQYEGGMEQNFDTDVPTPDCFPAMVDMETYISEMRSFLSTPDKHDFNLTLK